MLTKGQKIYMYVSALVAMVIGIITFIPFRTLPFLCNLNNVENVINAEIWIKVLILPLVVFALSAYANVKKYQEIEDGLDRSKVINVLSYFPIVSYLVGILVFIIHTLTYSYLPLGFNLWAVVVVLLVLYVLFVIFAFHIFPNVVIKLDRLGTLLMDISVVVITVCFALVAWRVNASYYAAFGMEESFVGKGDVLLFFLYIVSLIVVIVLCNRLFVLIKKDNRSIYVNTAMFEKNYEQLVKTEYNRAYNDIMDDFELYFSDHYEDEFTENTESQPASEEPQEEKVEEVVKQDEEQETEKVVSEVVETKEVTTLETKEPAKPKAEKVIKPSYKEIVAYGTSFKDKEVRVVANAKETQHKFYLGKKDVPSYAKNKQ